MKALLDFILVEERFLPGVLIVAVILAASFVGGGVILSVRNPRRLATIVKGMVLATSGPTLVILWLGYSLFISLYGLDSVKMLLLNLAFFVTVGSLWGVLSRLAFDWLDRTDEDELERRLGAVQRSSDQVPDADDSESRDEKPRESQPAAPREDPSVS